jgi:hypothetical protein
MEDFVSLRLPRQFINDLLDDLVEQIRMLSATADYLDSGIVSDDGLIADTSDEYEALFQAEYYQAVLACIRSQL